MITLTREEAQRLIDALLAWEEECSGYGWSTNDEECVALLRAKLSEPEPEPVAWKVWTVHNHIFFSIGVQTFQINDVLEHEPEFSAKEFSEWLATQLRHALTLLSTTPPQREWVGLTHEEIEKIVYNIRRETMGVVTTEYLAVAIQAKLKEKNND